jgi:hypothetical protein
MVFWDFKYFRPLIGLIFRLILNVLGQSFPLEQCCFGVYFETQEDSLILTTSDHNIYIP